MTLIRILFWFIVFYSLFKFLIRVVLPLVITTRSVRSKMKDMRQNMEASGHDNNTTAAGTEGVKSRERSAPAKGDYIDFEEIK